MKRKTARFLSVLLAVAMLAGLLSVTALADGESEARVMVGFVTADHTTIAENYEEYALGSEYVLPTLEAAEESAGIDLGEGTLAYWEIWKLKPVAGTDGNLSKRWGEGSIGDAEDGAATVEPGKAGETIILDTDVLLAPVFEEMCDGVPLLTGSQDEETAPAFADVAEDSWYKAAVDYVAGNGLMNGVGGDKFDPDGMTTRGMLVTILWRMEGEPAAAAAAAFDDVEDGEWYADAVAWAAGAGVAEGCGDGKFAPTEDITREQFATILFRYAKYKGYDVSVGEDTNVLSYNDAFDVSEWAMPAIQWACGAEVMHGDDLGNLLPDSGATRSEAAALIMRFVENVK